MRVFGLTGGIASGKSAVARIWRGLGVPILDADELAREVVKKGTAGLAAIRAAFGDAVIASDGELDRKALAKIIFADDEKRKTLNAITHPKIYALSAERAAELAKKGEVLACYEAALLVENKMADAFRPLVVVSAPRETQIERAVARDGASIDDATKRIDAQVPLEEKISVADIVIDNAGTLADLEKQARDALRAVCTELHVDPSRFAV